MKLTTKIVVIGAGCTADDAVKWLPYLQAACDEFKIASPQETAAFLANVGVESAGLTVLSENLNYSAARLAVVWPHAFAENPHADHKVPNAAAYSCQHNPEHLANTIYANKNGNGAYSSGDGWKYRGGGLFQLTFLNNYRIHGKRCNLDLVNHPELARTMPGSAMTAASFFALNCGGLTDFAQIVRKINGQPPCEANHGPLRQKRYADTLAALQALEKTTTKASAPDEAKAIIAAETATK